MLLAAVVGLGLAGYLALSSNALRLASRTLFTNDATNLAEAGLEEALYCFNRLNAGATVAAAWTGWTRSGANAMRTLPPFNRDQNAVGIVKVFVKGCDGSDADPLVISQATITPFDRTTPIVKILQINLGKNAYFVNGVVGINGLTMRGDGVADSYNSNPSARPTGPWTRFNTRDATGTTSVAIATGALQVSSASVIRGDLYVGTGISAAGVRVTGAIYPDFKGTFPMPVYPSNSTDTTTSLHGRRGRGVPKSIKAKSGNLASVLPRPGDQPASDGRYYYFCDNTTIGNVTISPGAAVTIVGTRTDMASGLDIRARASCQIYIDGPVNLTGRTTIESGDWAGALQIFTTTARDCRIATGRPIYGCVYAPNALLTFTGDIDLPTTIVGSFVAGRVVAEDNINFIYDHALTALHAGKIWNLAAWSEVRQSSDRAALTALTNSFLP